jgi:hypothetical protein
MSKIEERPQQLQFHFNEIIDFRPIIKTSTTTAIIDIEENNDNLDDSSIMEELLMVCYQMNYLNTH